MELKEDPTSDAGRMLWNAKLKVPKTGTVAEEL